MRPAPTPAPAPSPKAAIDRPCAPHAPYRPHRAQLTGEQARLYDLLLDGILCQKSRVRLPRGTTGSQVQPLLEHIRQENPLALFEGARVVRCYAFGPAGTFATLELRYRPDTAELQARAHRIVQDVLRRCGSPTAGEAALALRFHDHLAARCRYAPDEALAHEAVGALVNGAAVCDGISKAYKLLCDEAGIACTVVTGCNKGPHAWNVARVAGHWAHVDVTDDLPSQAERTAPLASGRALAPEERPAVSHAHFGLSDQEVLCRRSVEPPCPACPHNLGFYRSLGLYAENPAQFAGVCRRQFEHGARDFEVELGGRLAGAATPGPQGGGALLAIAGSALLQAGRSGNVQLSTGRPGVVRIRA